MGLSGIAQRLPRWWYQRKLAAALIPLLPLSLVFSVLVALRRLLYRSGLLSSRALPVPVIVVGNLTVGGSGKTPLVLWLVKQLCAQGWRPGIISRGYGAELDGVCEVDSNSASAGVGDEPLLLARRSAVPVFVGRDRLAAGESLLAAHPECNVIVSDDGLQHYRLQRRIEIAVFDGRVAGNRWMLPAGPLREPLKRLSDVSAVIWNSLPDVPDAAQGALSHPAQFAMRLEATGFVSLNDAERFCSAEDLRGRRVYAIAGIGDPSRFFNQLTAMGLTFDAHAFPDHHAYCADDLSFASDGVLLMTEKDAVKCAALHLPDAWVLPVEAQLMASADGHSLLQIILEKLNGCPPA